MCKVTLAKYREECVRLPTMSENLDYTHDAVIIGGLGHVGLPLGIVFADKGLKVCLYDIDPVKAEVVRRGEMPFIEYGAEAILQKVLDNGNLEVSLDAECISKARHVIVAIGTPADEYLNPRVRAFLEFMTGIKRHLRTDQVIIVRSTVYPSTCRQMLKRLGESEPWLIAYCPERIVQGFAVKELSELPQVVAGMSDEAAEKAAALFGIVSPKIIRTTIAEAELVKLFSNAWRYIQFAVTNQFYMISRNFGVDYNNVRRVMMDGYGRAATLPSAGFTAGPCLLKDTMQLAAFNGNNFILGHAAMMINEGLPNFIVEQLRNKYDLTAKKVGILGMAFKADVDDIRDSLSYKVGKILRFHGATVLYSDEFVRDPTFVSKEDLLSLCDVVIIGSPHSAYRHLNIHNGTDVVDLWGIIPEN